MLTSWQILQELHLWISHLPKKVMISHLSRETEDCRNDLFPCDAEDSVIVKRFAEESCFLCVLSETVGKGGKTKPQVLILISRRLINIIYGMLKNKTEYQMPEVRENSN